MNRRRLRAVLLTNELAPYRLPLFEALGRHLDLRVLLCSQKDTNRLWQTEQSLDTGRYFQLESRTWRPFRRGASLIWNPGLPEFLQDNHFDVYIAGENLPTSLSVIRMQHAARQAGKPFILWSGAIDTPYAHGNLMTNLYRRWLYGRADAFVVYGQKAAEYLIRRRAPAEAIFAGTQVMAPGWLQDAPCDKQALGLAGKTIILFVGYLVPRKGVHDLIQAYQRVRRPDTVLVIVGDGHQREELEASAATIEDILFTGYLKGKEKFAYYAAADIFVLPTYHDPWPQVIIEALFFGLPIITTDRDGSASEVIDGNGLIVRAANQPDLIAALMRLLDNPTLRQQMGRRSHEISLSYGLGRATQTFLSAIEYARNSSKTTVT